MQFRVGRAGVDLTPAAQTTSAPCCRPGVHRPGPTSVSEPANAPRAAVSVERCALAAPPNASALWAAHVPSLPPVRVGSLNLTLVDSNFTQGWRVVWAKAGLNRATVTRCRFAGITGGAALVLNQACRTVALMDTVFEDNDLTSNGGGVSSSSGSSSSGSSSNSRGNVGTDPLVVINTALGNAQPMAESSTVTTNATGDLVRVTFQRCALTNNTGAHTACVRSVVQDWCVTTNRIHTAGTLFLTFSFLHVCTSLGLSMHMCCNAQCLQLTLHRGSYG